MRRNVGRSRGGRGLAVLVTTLAVTLGGCGGSGSTAPATTDDLALYTQQGLRLISDFTGELHQVMPMFLAPSVAADNGVVVTLDTSVGAAPNTYICHIPLDLSGDGTKETVVEATVVLNGDLFTFGPGFGGTIDATITRSGATVSLDLEFLFLDDGVVQMSGSIALAGALSGIEVTGTIDAGSPLLIKLATGEVDAVGNACTFSVEGDAHVEATRGIEALSALWRFASSSKNIQVLDATRVDEEGVEHDLPDSSFQIPCEIGTLSDWVGTYDFNWFCNPQEEGTSVFVITVTGPNTIHIDDDGFPYDAVAVPGNPHIVRGFFISNGYREDFCWTLSRDARTFIQQSVYLFQPPLTGGGICGGTGTKRP